MSQMLKTRKLTQEQAVNHLSEMARAKLRIIARTAKLDADIAERKAKLADTNAADEAIINEREPLVTAYLLANKETICARRKKTFETQLVKYGFRKCSDTVIDDQDAVIQFARDNGYLDLFKDPQPKIMKSAVAKRIKAGQDIPGARVDSDDEPFWEPTKTMLQEAKRGKSQ